MIPLPILYYPTELFQPSGILQNCMNYTSKPKHRNVKKTKKHFDKTCVPQLY